MNGIEKAHLEKKTIRIEKLSAMTDTGCVSLDVLEFLGIKHDPLSPVELIGNNVWKAKVGKNGGWAYGRNINAALEAAFLVSG